jgi:hypothetical protein
MGELRRGKGLGIYRMVATSEDERCRSQGDPTATQQWFGELGRGGATGLAGWCAERGEGEGEQVIPGVWPGVVLTVTG